MRKALGFGMHVPAPRIDGADVMDRVRRECDRFVSFLLEAVEKIEPNQRLNAMARFTGQHTLVLDSGETIEAARIIIATVSAPVQPSVFDSVGDRLIVNDEVFDWSVLSEAVAVFGGGIIGLELAQALGRLGIQVRLFGKGGGGGEISDPRVSATATKVRVSGYPTSRRIDVQLAARVHPGPSAS